MNSSPEGFVPDNKEIKKLPLQPLYKGVPWYGETPLPGIVIRTPQEIETNLRMAQSGSGNKNMIISSPTPDGIYEQ